MDHVAEAAKLRRRAEQCRALANAMADHQARRGYLALAEAYETLARSELAMIGLPHGQKPSE